MKTSKVAGSNPVNSRKAGLPLFKTSFEYFYLHANMVTLTLVKHKEAFKLHLGIGMMVGSPKDAEDLIERIYGESSQLVKLSPNAYRPGTHYPVINGVRHDPVDFFSKKRMRFIDVKYNGIYRGGKYWEEDEHKKTEHKVQTSAQQYSLMQGNPQRGEHIGEYWIVTDIFNDKKRSGYVGITRVDAKQK